MTKWICTICHHEQETPEKPGQCPSCQAEIRSMLPTDAYASKGDEGEFHGLVQNLEEARDRARKKLRGFCAVYPACDGRPDRICQREAYGKPIGMGGSGSGAGFKANVAALERQRLRTRVTGDSLEPELGITFLDQEIALPVMGASTAGISRFNDTMTEVDFCRATIRGCREAGTLTWRGDTWFYTPDKHPALDALEKENGQGIPIFKPRAQDVLRRLIERAEKANCPAVGVDLDGFGSTIMARHGQQVFRKSKKDLQALTQFTSLPFIAKGVMSGDDAARCVEAGVKVVAVSNHGGRVLDHTPGVADVLPEIVERIGGKAVITADGGVRTGYDVIKMLALGADAVLMGRDIIRAAVGGGTKGVHLQMERIKTTLRQAMIMTGCPDCKTIDRDILV